MRCPSTTTSTASSRCNFSAHLEFHCFITFVLPTFVILLLIDACLIRHATLDWYSFDFCLLLLILNGASLFHSCKISINLGVFHRWVNNGVACTCLLHFYFAAHCLMVFFAADSNAQPTAVKVWNFEIHLLQNIQIISSSSTSINDPPLPYTWGEGLVRQQRLK